MKWRADLVNQTKGVTRQCKQGNAELISKLISFDLQGTISDSAFSDEFWLELLPRLYATKNRIQVQEAKIYLETAYRTHGRYNELFYDHRLRLSELLPNATFEDILSMLKTRPQLDLDMMGVVKSIPGTLTKIIFSAATHEFIDFELGLEKTNFKIVLSSIDDFKVAGKPPSLYINIANLMGVAPENCLHIGDCHEMDFENAKKAGWQSYHFDHNAERDAILAALHSKIQQFVNT